jgi:hypothetical protein
VSNIADLLITTERHESFNNIQHVQRSSSPLAQKRDRDQMLRGLYVLRATGYEATGVCTFTNRTFRYLLPEGVQVYGTVSSILKIGMGFRFTAINMIAIITIPCLGPGLRLGISSREDRTLRLNVNANVHVTSCATHTV